MLFGQLLLLYHNQNCVCMFLLYFFWFFFLILDSAKPKCFTREKTKILRFRITKHFECFLIERSQTRKKEGAQSRCIHGIYTSVQDVVCIHVFKYIYLLALSLFLSLDSFFFFQEKYSHSSSQSCLYNFFRCSVFLLLLFVTVLCVMDVLVSVVCWLL